MARLSMSMALYVALFACMSVSVEANAFLGRVMPAIADPDFERHLLAEMEVILGSEHRSFTEKRLKRIEQDLKPMFTAMPKTSNGKLDHVAIGYVLHRAFVQRHGWFVRSLTPEGSSMTMWSGSTPSSVLENHGVGDHVIDAFEKHMGGGGTGLHELAVLQATLEHLVHKEALEKLRIAYEARGFKADDVVSAEEAESVMDAYLAVYILGGYFDQSNITLTPGRISKLLKNVGQVYPNWDQTRKFMGEIKERVAPKRDYLYFADVASVVEEVGEHFGEFQDRECHALKDELLKLELPGAAGRVRLADFYKPAVHEGSWSFTESAGYLRQLGALDESDPANPRVIISNYVNGPSNCIASSSYYSVCCRDECEGLMGHLERELLAPNVPPAQLAALVAALPSRTETANRTLSPWLVDRLEDVAKHHGGLVPMHGRLFAQWMHFAFPRECPYPHVAGAINPTRLEEALTVGPSTQDNLDAIMATMDQMREHVEAAANATTAVNSDLNMWTLEEELLVTRPEMAPSLAEEPRSLLSSSLRGLALVGAVFSASWGIANGVRAGCSPGYDVASQKYMV